MTIDLELYLNFARETARAAGQRTLAHFQNAALQPGIKSDGSPVTIADRESEALVRSAIEKQFPTHAILGEEFGATNPSASFRWLIDPIDGTQSFIHGVPLYSVLIGLEIEGVVEVGVAYFPALNEMISAGSGLGCWWNDRPARVSKETQLSRSALAFTDLGNFRKRGIAGPLNRLADRAWCRAGWGDAYGYLLVATGRIEMMLDPVMEVWDCGPFPPIFREAGGYFGDWQGNRTIYTDKTLATTNALLPEVLAVLNSGPAIEMPVQ